MGHKTLGGGCHKGLDYMNWMYSKNVDDKLTFNKKINVHKWGPRL